MVLIFNSRLVVKFPGQISLLPVLLHIHIYIYMYIRIAFSIELRLRVSRSLCSLANYISIFHPNNPPLVLGMLVGSVATDTSSNN